MTTVQPTAREAAEQLLTRITDLAKSAPAGPLGIFADDADAALGTGTYLENKAAYYRLTDRIADVHAWDDLCDTDEGAATRALEILELLAVLHACMPLVVRALRAFSASPATVETTLDQLVAGPAARGVFGPTVDVIRAAAAVTVVDER